ncbi:MAG: hypothetical protein U0173_13680 [Nitrospiraceae bacterium]
MNHRTIWGWWYGMLLALPLIMVGLLAKEWVTGLVHHRVAGTRM